MNKVVLMGRLTKDPDVRVSSDQVTIARYTLAVDRTHVKQDANGNRQADFISCVAFGKGGEFAEKYLRKGMKVCIQGHIQTGSYTNKDGRKIYNTDIVVEEHEFAESRKDNGARNDYYDQMAAGSSYSGYEQTPGAPDGFMNIPDGIDEELPFS